MAGLPYTGMVGNAATVAQQAGYGRRRKRRVGSGLYAAGGKMRRGGALKMAGGARHMISSRRPMTW